MDEGMMADTGSLVGISAENASHQSSHCITILFELLSSSGFGVLGL